MLDQVRAIIYARGKGVDLFVDPADLYDLTNLWIPDLLPIDHSNPSEIEF